MPLLLLVVPSESESDDDSKMMGLKRQPADRPSSVSEQAALPPSEHRRYVREMPATGSELVGWPIMALFPEYDEQPLSEQKWHHMYGVVVAHDSNMRQQGFDYDDYLLFYEMDSEWERVTLPDDTEVYRKGKASEVRTTHVTQHMLPDDELDVM